MDGLIVNQPFANLIIKKKKRWELRAKRPPAEKINLEMYLLSQGYMLGKIKIKNIAGPLKFNELKEKHYLDHSSVDHIDNTFSCYAWEISVCETFGEPKKYVHPHGARVWVKNVLSMEQYLRSKLTSYM